MDTRAMRAGPRQRLDLASVRSGKDGARWLDQAMPAQPFGTRMPASGQLTAAWAALVQLARREGFSAERCCCADSDAVITWADRRIHLPRHACLEAALAALAHQLAHVLLHAEAAYLSRPGTFACRAVRHAEANSVAYLVAAHLGITTTAITLPCPPRWAGQRPRDQTTSTMQAVTDRVIAAAAQIIRYLDAPVAADLGSPRQGRSPRPGDCGHIPASPGPALPGYARAGGVRCGQADGPRPRRAGHRASSSPAPQPSGAAAPGTPAGSRGQLLRVHHAAARFFRSQLAGSGVAGYLTGRGFGPATQASWQAGYAPAAWDALTRHLRGLGYPAAVIEAAGLAHTSRRGTLIDTFRDRAILPIRNADGAVAGFIGRARDDAGPQVPRYLNSPTTALYRKRAVLFGLWQARRLLARGARPVITEGPFDAIAVTAATAGRFAGTAPCGTALTPEQGDALARFADLTATGAVVAFDPDQAGRRAAVAAYHLLAPLTADLTAAALPAGHDPAGILASCGPAALTSALAHASPLADLVIDAEVGGWSRWLRYPEGQFNALRGAAALIAAMPPGQAARQVARLAHRLGLDYATVTDAVTEAVADAVDRASTASDGSKPRRAPA